jgi:hypothetical protein
MVGKYLTCYLLGWFETWRCFITIAFQLCSGVPREGVQTPLTPKFQIGIWVSLICKLSGTPDYHPQIPVLSALCLQLNLLNPLKKKNSWVCHCYFALEYTIS